MPTIDAATDAVWARSYDREIDAHWPPERRHVDAMYMDLPFPFAEIAHEPWEMRATLTREQWLGYVGTWSAVSRARERTGTDPVSSMRDDLKAVWTDTAEDVRSITWPIGLRVGRKTN